MVALIGVEIMPLLWLHLDGYYGDMYIGVNRGVLSYSAAQQPSLPELLSFSTITGDTINVMSRVGHECKKLGYILLNDSDGAIVDQITDDCNHKAEKIMTEIMKRWIRGKGKQPVTWETLIKALRTIGLTELASCVEKSL